MVEEIVRREIESRRKAIMAHLEILSVSDGDPKHFPEHARYLGQVYRLEPGTVLELSGDRVRVGRTADNDLVLPLLTVSKHHLCLTLRAGRWVYEDLRSRQIPVYNRALIDFDAVRIMEDQDTFTVAGVEFRYCGK